MGTGLCHRRRPGCAGLGRGPLAALWWRYKDLCAGLRRGGGGACPWGEAGAGRAGGRLTAAGSPGAQRCPPRGARKPTGGRVLLPRKQWHRLAVSSAGLPCCEGWAGAWGVWWRAPVTRRWAWRRRPPQLPSEDALGRKITKRKGRGRSGLWGSGAARHDETEPCLQRRVALAHLSCEGMASGGDGGGGVRTRTRPPAPSQGSAEGRSCLIQREPPGGAVSASRSVSFCGGLQGRAEPPACGLPCAAGTAAVRVCGSACAGEPGCLPRAEWHCGPAEAAGVALPRLARHGTALCWSEVGRGAELRALGRAAAPCVCVCVCVCRDRAPLRRRRREGGEEEGGRVRGRRTVMSRASKSSHRRRPAAPGGARGWGAAAAAAHEWLPERGGGASCPEGGARGSAPAVYFLFIIIVFGRGWAGREGGVGFFPLPPRFLQVPAPQRSACKVLFSRGGGPGWDEGPGARLPAASRRTAAATTGAGVGAPWESLVRALNPPPSSPPPSSAPLRPSLSPSLPPSPRCAAIAVTPAGQGWSRTRGASCGRTWRRGRCWRSGARRTCSRRWTATFGTAMCTGTWPAAWPSWASSAPPSSAASASRASSANTTRPGTGWRRTGTPARYASTTTRWTGSSAAGGGPTVPPSRWPRRPTAPSRQGRWPGRPRRARRTTAVRWTPSWTRTPSWSPPATTSPRTPGSAPPTPTTPSKWSAPPSPSPCHRATVSSWRALDAGCPSLTPRAARPPSRPLAASLPAPLSR